MLAFELISWWYGVGIRRLVGAIGTTIRTIVLTLSVPILIQTLFSPWRRIITYGGRSIADQLRAVLDNLISRLVGGVVRLIVLFIALLGITATAALGLALVIIWPLTPVLGVGLIIWGLF